MRKLIRLLLVFKGSRTLQMTSLCMGNDQALRDTLQKLKLNGLTLNRPKCLFQQPKIELFGYVLSGEGVSPDPAKVQALREAERPSNAEEVRSFLGMANYSARFIKNFSILAAPLRELTRSNVKMALGRERARGVYEDQEFIAR